MNWFFAFQICLSKHQLAPPPLVLKHVLYEYLTFGVHNVRPRRKLNPGRGIPQYSPRRRSRARRRLFHRLFRVCTFVFISFRCLNNTFEGIIFIFSKAQTEVHRWVFN